MQNKSTNSDANANGPAARNANAHTDGALSSVSREFHNFLADIEDLIKDTTALTGDDLARATAKINQRVATARESVEDMGGEVVHRAKKTAYEANHYVHEQPWRAIGIGAAVGFLMGFVVTRRS